MQLPIPVKYVGFASLSVRISAPGAEFSRPGTPCENIRKNNARFGELLEAANP